MTTKAGLNEVIQNQHESEQVDHMAPFYVSGEHVKSKDIYKEWTLGVNGRSWILWFNVQVL